MWKYVLHLIKLGFSRKVAVLGVRLALNIDTLEQYENGQLDLWFRAYGGFAKSLVTQSEFRGIQTCAEYVSKCCCMTQSL